MYFAADDTDNPTRAAMITYTYRCDDCGQTFEARQRITEDPLTECPACGGAVRRLISGGLGTLDVAHDSSKACSSGGG
jgi:putative FmdB family regulatory protein